jgi:hypothetical protein
MIGIGIPKSQSNKPRPKPISASIFLCVCQIFRPVNVLTNIRFHDKESLRQ